MSRTLVCGDVHGGNRALVQGLERANFDPSEDKLIFLGDCADGWSQVYEAIVTLDKYASRILWGNHDSWLAEWLNGNMPIYDYNHWLTQGGRASVNSVQGTERREFARNFFNKAVDYSYDLQRDFLYVHAGVPINTSGEDVLLGKLPDRDYLTWDRELFRAVISAPDKKWTKLKRVFIGHTTTTRTSSAPIHGADVTLCDTGGGWEGRLSLIDIDSLEYWQSDPVHELYPNEKGRF